MSNVFQEVENGNVLMEWDSASVPSLYSDSFFENQFGTLAQSGIEDYLHTNSITIDPVDQNFIVSFRHTSSIVKIDRHSGQILWTLGGKEDQFGLTGDQVFSFQHHVRKHADGTITIFDNGDGPEALHGTRVLQVALDETNHKVTSFTVLYTKDPSLTPTGYMGSAVPLDGGRLFLGWGGGTRRRCNRRPRRLSTGARPGASSLRPLDFSPTGRSRSPRCDRLASQNGLAAAPLRTDA